jgi:hypothetical protein
LIASTDERQLGCGLSFTLAAPANCHLQLTARYLELVLRPVGLRTTRSPQPLRLQVISDEPVVPASRNRWVEIAQK